MNPNWYGRRYPTPEDLILAIETTGAVILYAEIGDGALFVAGEPPIPPVVILPVQGGVLLLSWLLAHELGHLTLHGGYTSRWTHDRQEHQANVWAARALIPDRSIREHKNASLDAFLAALSIHYEHLPLEDCSQRRLAAEIATIRLKAVEEVA